MTRWEVIGRMIRVNNWTMGAELGLFKGETFFYLLDTFPNLKMIGVDHWERTPGPKQDRETGFASYEHEPMEQYAKTVIKKSLTYGSRVIIHHGKTKYAASLLNDKTLDFVFIDASHDTQSVHDDIVSWTPKLKKGGYLIGHDINWPSVQRALENLHIDWDEAESHIWYFKP